MNAMTRCDRLLVVGAGPVGLAMAKALLKYDVPFDQVDANEGVGGLWRSGVYRTAHIVSSKRSTAFTDYPMPADYPDFPSAAQMLRYLESYARDAGLAGRIEFEKRVLKARPLEDSTWAVEFADGEQRTYKGVVICNGHHWDAKLPTWPGTFAGEIIHSRTYRGPGQLAGKRVLVVGGGNSACDVASEAARVAASADLSMRSGYWFLPKTAFGRPLTDLPIWSLPVFLQRLILRGLIRITIGDYRSYGLPRPTHRIFERHPMFGTEVLGYIRQGRVTARADIERLDGRRVHFKDGTSGEYDLIVAATGYNQSFPFLPAGLVGVVNDTAQIYCGAFPPNVRNLYIVGSNQPRNGFGGVLTPASDLYARMIRMQDELEPNLGDIFANNGDRLPVTNLINPARARLEIWLGQKLLPLLKWQARRCSRAQERQARLKPSASPSTSTAPTAGGFGSRWSPR